MSPWCKELSDPPQNCQQCHCCCLKTPKEQNARVQNDVCLQLIPKTHFLFRLRGTISAQTGNNAVIHTIILEVSKAAQYPTLVATFKQSPKGNVFCIRYSRNSLNENNVKSTRWDLQGAPGAQQLQNDGEEEMLQSATVALWIQQVSNQSWRDGRYFSKIICKLQGILVSGHSYEALAHPPSALQLRQLMSNSNSLQSASLLGQRKKPTQTL